MFKNKLNTSQPFSRSNQTNGKNKNHLHAVSRTQQSRQRELRRDWP